MLRNKYSGGLIGLQYSLKIGVFYYVYALDRRQSTIVNLIVFEYTV